VSYKVGFDEEAIKFLEKLPNPIKKRIYSKIISTKENPHHFFERLTERADYRLRVGDYRVIADIDDSGRLIKVTLIGHRKNVYDKR
jgi:mRNA interferase RelE/StbE